MGKTPIGLQEHVLFDMDGRQWIENIHTSGIGAAIFDRALERGDARLIPQDKLREFIASLNDSLPPAQKKPKT